MGLGRAVELRVDSWYYANGPPPPAAPESRVNHPRRLSPGFSGALRTFSYWMAAGSVGEPLLRGVSYREVMLDEPSLMEAAYAIFANVLEFDAAGNPVNAKYAEHRAAQHIRAYCDPSYVVEPPLEGWEVELYDPPPLRDPEPGSSRG
jgi:hypothetical protein